MFYAMAMLKSKTPISSSHGQHKEARPSIACINKFVKNFLFILLPLFLLSFKSEKKLTFMSIQDAVLVRCLYCICPVLCDARESLKTSLSHRQKQSCSRSLRHFKKTKKISHATLYVANRMRENDSVACDATRQMHF